MNDSIGQKRPRPRPPQEEEQKRHNTRSTRQNSTATNPNEISTPIRIHPSSHSLYFLRLDKLFFYNEKECESITKTSDAPRIVRFGNTRLQSIYNSPNIYMIDQFLSVSDIQYLFTHFISRFKFQRSFVDEGCDGENGEPDDEDESVPGGSKRSQQPNKSSHRTSAFLSLNKQHDSRIASIEHKVASLFGCTTKQIEALQLVRYQSPNQYFHVHHDLGIYDEATGHVELPRKSIWYQRRMVTLFCYLNTVPRECGGATHFPFCTNQNRDNESLVPDEMLYVKSTASMAEEENNNMEHQDSSKNDPDCETQNQSRNKDDQSIVVNHDGLRVYPVAGRAVVFSNVLSSGVPDPRVIHAGEPVIVSRNNSVTNTMYPDMKCHSATQASSSKIDEYYCSKIKYGLNIWICES